MSDGLSEERIKEIGTFQFPDEKMEAYTIQKDFRNALDPIEKFEYKELPVY